MCEVKTRDVLIASAASYGLWVLTWLALVVPGNPCFRWERWEGVPQDVVLLIIMAFLFAGCVTTGTLSVLYRLVERLRLAPRWQGEILFVSGYGLCGGLVLKLLSSTVSPWWAWLLLWGFLSLPALYTVLCLRGWEWYRRRNAG